MGFAKGHIPTNKKDEIQYDKLQRLRQSIELPAMLWCADSWLKVGMRLAHCGFNKKKHNTTLLTGLQLAGLEPYTTQTLLSKGVEEGLIYQRPINRDGHKVYDITNKGVRFILAITCMSEVMSRSTFDDTFPFASNLHNNKGHRFKSNF